MHSSKVPGAGWAWDITNPWKGLGRGHTKKKVKHRTRKRLRKQQRTARKKQRHQGEK